MITILTASVHYQRKNWKKALDNITVIIEIHLNDKCGTLKSDNDFENPTTSELDRKIDLRVAAIRHGHEF